MIRVRMKGEYGEVEVECHPKNLSNINGQPTIVGNDSISLAIKAYKALKEESCATTN